MLPPFVALAGLNLEWSSWGARTTGTFHCACLGRSYFKQCLLGRRNSLPTGMDWEPSANGKEASVVRSDLGRGEHYEKAQKYQADMTSWLQSILGLLYNYMYYIICKLSDSCGKLNPVDDLVSQILPRCSLRTCKTRESSPYWVKHRCTVTLLNVLKLNGRARTQARLPATTKDFNHWVNQRWTSSLWCHLS